MKHLIQKSLGRMGYELRRKRPALPLYRTSLQTLLSCQSHVNIVQVGANDGRLSDPIHDFVRGAPSRTSILLIEPQEYLIPILKENYSFHDAASVFQGAVGPGEDMVLHAVKREYWSKLKTIPYARGWPEYRAPTGVTSFDRDHVVRFLRNYLKEGLRVDEAITSLALRALPLTDIIDRSGFTHRIDVLQVDAEGYDDQIIYNSDIAFHCPKLINFESSNLSPDKLLTLESFLEARGYLTVPTGPDTLAIHMGPPIGDRS